jgi:hypothetical protein
MKEKRLKEPLRREGLMQGADAARRCLDRIREAERYPLSSEITKKRATQKSKTGKDGQRRVRHDLPENRSRGQEHDGFKTPFCWAGERQNSVRPFDSPQADCGRRTPRVAHR